MSVARQQSHVGIGYGTLATCVALLVFLAMLGFLSDRWVVKFPPLPDFASYEQVKDMKVAFLDYLTPIVEYHNAQVLHERKRLQKIHRAIEDDQTLACSQSRWLRGMAQKYDVDWNPQNTVAVTTELANLMPGTGRPFLWYDPTPLFETPLTKDIVALDRVPRAPPG